MTNTALETVLRRDRLVVAGAVGLLAVLAWSYVLWLAAGMDMGGMIARLAGVVLVVKGAALFLSGT